MNKILFVILLQVVLAPQMFAREHFAEKEFGSYIIHENYIESEKYSNDGKYYYVNKKDYGKIGYVNNISICKGVNKYTKSQHTLFRDAIIKQISWQQQNTNATISGDGSYSKNGYIIYTFQIIEGLEVKYRYYIIDKDFEYILIETTARSEYENIDEAAQLMINSFLY